MTISADTQVRSPADLIATPHARIPDLAEAVQWLASPDSGKSLALTGAGELTDGSMKFACRAGLPVLLPQRLAPFFDHHLKVPAHAATDAFLKYFLLSSLRHEGDINAASSNVHFQRHLHRMHAFVQPCEGLVLDVGCDDAALGSSLFSPRSCYLGLDPFCRHLTPFRIIGLGEFLPIRPDCVDVVVFNTTLDHIFDWHRALDEAHRVLRPGGHLVIATLIWTANADLLSDSVHFHHFREYEIVGALSNFSVEAIERYDYKGDQHRHGMYLRATKR